MCASWDSGECGATARNSPSRRGAVKNAAAPGTRHHTLLNSNLPPEDHEVAFIESVISTSDARLARLEDEISKLRKTLKRLEEERVSLYSSRDQHIALLSPLRRMPPEVLCQIFSWTMEHFDSTGAYPWVLTHVSSVWRALALSTPSLWSWISFDYSATTYSLALVTAQIERCRKLDIRFYGCSEVDSRPQIQMFELLAQHSSRWEELIVGLTSDLIPSLTGLRDRVPSLTRLTIHWNEPETVVTKFINCFETACSLRNASVYHIPGARSFVRVALPIHQLTHYQLMGTWEQHRDLLRQATNLIQARISITFGHEPDPDSNPDEIIDLPRLRCLGLASATIFCYIKAPALEELILHCLADDNPSDVVDPLTAFVNRSALHLRRLFMTGSVNAETTTQSTALSPATCSTP
ncbi:hypothetical protein DFH06DRAFT_1202884 [Mycena polygramma]|nr:hypothetical protein DFH06DRAFT_1202884 [Mycena polygramma]